MPKFNILRSPADAVTVSLWGNPDQLTPPGGSVPRAQVRARRFFTANPDRQFYFEDITHAQLANLPGALHLTGSIDHPRSHETNTHRDAEISGPGPHALVFNRDWFVASPWAGEYLPGHLPAGVLILPNVSARALLRGRSSAAQEGFGRFLWAMWDAATGIAETGDEAIMGVLQIGADLREAGLL